MDQVWPIGCEGNSTMQATVIFPSPVSVLLYRNTREGCRSYLRTRISPSIMNGGWVAEQSVFVPSLTWIDCRVGAVFSVPRPVVFCVSAWRRLIAVAFTDGRSPKIPSGDGDAMHRGEREKRYMYGVFCPHFGQNTPPPLESKGLGQLS